MGRRCTKRNGYKGRHFLYVLIMVQVECAPSKPSARRPSRVRAAQAECAPPKLRAHLSSRMRCVRVECNRSPPSNHVPMYIKVKAK
jgi:hypothetical protein